MRYPIRAVHFQLTGRCNLACRFCGQSKGMLACEGGELPVEFWVRCAGETEPGAAITFWGGEPLLYPGFEELAARLSGSGHPFDIVTNGTLIPRHAETLCRDFDRIFVSVDGPRELHDAVRGKGVFDRVKAALPLLDGRRGKLIFLTTVSDANVERMPTMQFRCADGQLRQNELFFQYSKPDAGRHPGKALNAGDVGYFCRFSHVDSQEKQP